jgi:hypothetical protein
MNLPLTGWRLFLALALVIVVVGFAVCWGWVAAEIRP